MAQTSIQQGTMVAVVAVAVVPMLRQVVRCLLAVAEVAVPEGSRLCLGEAMVVMAATEPLLTLQEQQRSAAVARGAQGGTHSRVQVSVDRGEMERLPVALPARPSVAVPMAVLG